MLGALVRLKINTWRIDSGIGTHDLGWWVLVAWWWGGQGPDLAGGHGRHDYCRLSFIESQSSDHPQWLPFLIHNL